MRPRLSKTETVLATTFAALVALALFGPPLALPAGYHEFADQRAFGGVPHTLDVLSNLPFAAAGLFGLYAIWILPRRALSNVERAMGVLFFAGLLLTALASSWYHWQPNNSGLAFDRSGMAVAFAGLLGLAAAAHVSERAGAMLGLSVLVLAPFAIHAASSAGNALPWAVLQFGGAALLVGLGLLRPRYWSLYIRWGVVIVAYLVAKVLEANDHQVFELTGQWVSGHTLKHLAAALAAWPVMAAVWKLRSLRDNPELFAITRRLSSGQAREA